MSQPPSWGTSPDPLEPEPPFRPETPLPAEQARDAKPEPDRDPPTADDLGPGSADVPGHAPADAPGPVGAPSPSPAPTQLLGTPTRAITPTLADQGKPASGPDTADLADRRWPGLRTRTLVFGLLLLAISGILLVALFGHHRIDGTVIPVVLLVGAGAGLLAGGIAATLREARGGPGGR